jgi:nicotinate-nucleotide pyrophosphorylase (carboxylating)
MRLILEPVVRAALLEDLGRAGDITTGAVVPAEATVEAVIGQAAHGRRRCEYGAVR